MIWNSTTWRQNKQGLLSVWRWLWSRFYSKYIELPTSPHTIPNPLNFAFITLFLPSASHIPEPPTKAYCLSGVWRVFGWRERGPKSCWIEAFHELSLFLTLWFLAVGGKGTGQACLTEYSRKVWLHPSQGHRLWGLLSVSCFPLQNQQKKLQQEYRQTTARSCFLTGFSLKSLLKMRLIAINFPLRIPGRF